MSLTRFRSGITILREDFINSLYGGLYGDSAGDDLDAEDPLISGHVHDGQHADGHAQKINLADHTTGQLDGANIEDNTITPDKLTSFTFDSIWATDSNLTSNSPGSLANDSLVFGSSDMDYDGDANHDSRMLFDKSLGAFRAGTATGTQWNTRGADSASFGHNNQADADVSFATGTANQIDSTSTGSAIINSNTSTITDAVYSTILGGAGNAIVSGADHSVIMGKSGRAQNPHSVVVGGGLFPHGSSSAGDVQVATIVLFGEWSATDTDVKYTLDGNTPAADNIVYLPTNSSAIVKVEYVLRGKQSATTFFGGGIMASIMGRAAGAVAIGTPLEIEGTSYRSSAVHTDDMFMSVSGNNGLGVATAAISSLVVVGVAGGFYFKTAFDGLLFGGAADAAGRAVATLTITQVGYTIP